jgi:hypothetical protein
MDMYEIIKYEMTIYKIDLWCLRERIYLMDIVDNHSVIVSVIINYSAVKSLFNMSPAQAFCTLQWRFWRTEAWNYCLTSLNQ